MKGIPRLKKRNLKKGKNGAIRKNSYSSSSPVITNWKIYQKILALQISPGEEKLNYRSYDRNST